MRSILNRDGSQDCYLDRPESKSWALVVHHLLRLEVDAQVGTFDLAIELNALFVAANRRLAGGRFLWEEEDGGGDQLAVPLALINHVAGSEFLLGFFWLQE